MRLAGFTADPGGRGGTLTAYDVEEPGKLLNIRVTHEGVIIDAYEEGVLTGTVGMTFEEWWEDLTSTGF